MFKKCNGFAGLTKENSPAPAPSDARSCRGQRLLCPRASFRTFLLCDPRAVVRFALGTAFLRAARFSFFRSALSSIDFVLAIDSWVPACGGVLVRMVLHKNK